MKKLIFTLAAALLVVPAMADEHQAPQGKPAVMSENGRHEAFQKARNEKMEQLKATQEKVEKLVKEYNKLKAGKKKEAKKAEIAAVVADIRAEQVKFNEKQLAQFEARLNQMRAELAKEQTPEAQQAWVNEKTEAVIANEGNLKILFDRGPKGNPKDGKGPQRMKGKDGKHFQGGKDGKDGHFQGRGPRPHGGPQGGPDMNGPQGFDGKDGQLPPPPPQD